MQGSPPKKQIVLCDNRRPSSNFKGKTGEKRGEREGREKEEEEEKEKGREQEKENRRKRKIRQKGEGRKGKGEGKEKEKEKEEESFFWIFKARTWAKAWHQKDFWHQKNTNCTHWSYRALKLEIKYCLWDCTATASALDSSHRTTHYMQSM